MEEIKVKLKESPLPSEAKPKKSWGKSFESAPGFSVKLTPSHWMAFYLDSGFMTGNFEERAKFLDSYKLIAHSITELGNGWNIYGEPTGKSGQFGITVYTESGKAISAGTGKISKAGGFTFSLSTLYKGMTNRGKISYSVSGKGTSDGGWEVTGTVTYTK